MPGYASRTGSTATATSTSCPISPRCASRAGSTRRALVLCDVHDEKTHEPVAVAPRSILRRQLDAAARSSASTAFAASELEHYVFRTSYREAARAGLSRPRARRLVPRGLPHPAGHAHRGASTRAVRRHLKHSGVPVETSKGEWGRASTRSTCATPRRSTMADRHVVFKQCLKEIAERLGMSVTFMAKSRPSAAPARAATSTSACGRDGKNAFAGDEPLGPIECSDAFRWFLGGWIAHVPRRDGRSTRRPSTPTSATSTRSWAPTRLAWSYDNRTAGFRVVGDGQSLRIECRIPGADCNPYLAFAAALASGLDGIAQPDRAAAMLRRRRLRGAATCRACPYTLARSDRRLRAERVRQARLSATTWSSTTRTSSGPSSARSTRPSPTGNGSATSRRI